MYDYSYRIILEYDFSNDKKIINFLNKWISRLLLRVMVIYEIYDFIIRNIWPFMLLILSILFLPKGGADEF